MSRSRWKGPYLNNNSMKNLKKIERDCFETVVSRNSTILPKFVNKTFEVYNGKKLNEIIITENMIGHKFGEFSPTRKRFAFKSKKK